MEEKFNQEEEVFELTEEEQVKILNENLTDVVLINNQVKDMLRILEALGINPNHKTFCGCGMPTGYYHKLKNRRTGEYEYDEEGKIKTEYIPGLSDVKTLDSWHKKSKQRCTKNYISFNDMIKDLKKSKYARGMLWLPRWMDHKQNELIQGNINLKAKYIWEIIVLDADTLADEKTLDDFLEQSNLKYIKVTSSRGAHYYFRAKILNETIPNKAKLRTNLGAMVDYRTSLKGGVVLPLNDKDRELVVCPDKDNLVDELPQMLYPTIQALNEYNKKKKVGGKGCTVDLYSLDSIPTISEGEGRNDTLLRLLRPYVNFQTYRNYDTLRTLSRGIMLENGFKPLLDGEELEKLLEHLLQDYAPPSFIEGDRIIPYRLAQYVAKTKTYKYYQKEHYFYNGTNYSIYKDKEDLQEVIVEYLEDTLISTRLLEEVESLIKLNNKVTIETRGKYVSCKNGVLDMKTQKLLPHSPDFFTTFTIDCDYNPDAIKKFKGSMFEQFLLTTYKNNNDLINVVQEVFGASLLPNPKRFKKLVILDGEGNNGKSVLINIIKKLHGGKVASLTLKDLLNDKFSTSALRGVNVSVDGDATSDKISETETLKKLCTGDAINTERKFKDKETSIMEVLMIFAMNKIGNTRDKTHGFFKRLLIIPHEQLFVAESELSKNPGALAEIQGIDDIITDNELDIVLAWSIEGLKRLLKNNYYVSKCEATTRAHNEYKQQVDSVPEFLKDCADGNIFYEFVTSAALYELYEEWCPQNDSYPVSSSTFGKVLSKRYQREKRQNARGFCNVTVYKIVGKLDVENKSSHPKII